MRHLLFFLLLSASAQAKGITTTQDASPSILSGQLQDLLTALYRTDAYIDDFEKELDELGHQVDLDPNFSAHPLETESYRNVQVMKVVVQQLEDQIVSIYGRLLKTSSDINVSPEVRDKAQKSIADVDKYLNGLSLEDQLQFSRLIEDLRQLQAGAGGQDVDLPDIDEANYNQFQEAIRYTETITRQKSQAALKQNAPTVDEAFQKVKSEQESTHKPYSPIRPSTGPDGNVDGTEFEDGVWALTFDDGPDRRYSSPLMDALLSHRDKINTNGAPASFFWLVEHVIDNPTVVKKAVENHFSTNCHSWTHLNLAKQNHATRVHEVIDAVNYERQAYGHDFRFYRCPGGACIAPAVPEVRQMLAALGLIHAYWSIDSLDWKKKNANVTFKFLTKQMKVQKHGIVLMHDIHPYSLQAAKMLLAWIADQNNSGKSHIELYTLDDAVDLYNQTGAISSSTHP